MWLINIYSGTKYKILMPSYSANHLATSWSYVPLSLTFFRPAFSLSNNSSHVKVTIPDALLLVHPECKKEVSSEADYIGSTTGIMSYAKNSDAKEFIIGTDNTIVQHLQFECPDKKFYALSKACVCEDMRLTTLMDVYLCLQGQGGEEIVMTEEMRLQAKKSIDAMLSMS